VVAELAFCKGADHGEEYGEEKLASFPTDYGSGELPSGVLERRLAAKEFLSLVAGDGSQVQPNGLGAR